MKRDSTIGRKEMRALVGVLVAACSLPSVAYCASPGQGPNTQSATGSSGSDSGPSLSSGTAVELEEIVVAAQRRTERLQDVPISVSTMNQASLEKMSVTAIEDVARLTP